MIMRRALRRRLKRCSFPEGNFSRRHGRQPAGLDLPREQPEPDYAARRAGRGGPDRGGVRGRDRDGECQRGVSEGRVLPVGAGVEQRVGAGVAGGDEPGGQGRKHHDDHEQSAVRPGDADPDLRSGRFTP